jgi:hypothetical protein
MYKTEKMATCENVKSLFSWKNFLESAHMFDGGNNHNLSLMALNLFPKLKLGSADQIRSLNIPYPSSSEICFYQLKQNQSLIVDLNSTCAFSLKNSELRIGLKGLIQALETKEYTPEAEDKSQVFRIKDQVFYYQSEKMSQALFALEDNLIERKELFSESVLHLWMAYFSGIDLFSFQAKLSVFLLERNTKVVRDQFTQIQFMDFSHIQGWDDVHRILKIIENDSTVVIGGKIDVIPEVIARVCKEKHLGLILLELFGPLDCDSKLQISRVNNIKEAIDMSYVLAENVSRIYLFPGIKLAQTLATVLSRKIELEVVI